MEEKKTTKITQSQFAKALNRKRNILVFGKSGWGKSQIVEQYAEQNKLKLLKVDLAGVLPEEITGIPVVEGDFYRRTLNKEWEDFFKAKGEGYVLFLDEITQGIHDVFNTLYSVCYPDSKGRTWAGHDISGCQIVACSNLSDGTDGTVYLNELPTPLLNRFFVFELKTSQKDATNYLKQKFKDIPQVGKYIKAMLENDIAPRDVELCLDIIQYDDGDSIFLESKLGETLAIKIQQLMNETRAIDPAEMLKNAKIIYESFKENGEVIFNTKTITKESDLIACFREYLSEEEIASIICEEEK